MYNIYDMKCTEQPNKNYLLPRIFILSWYNFLHPHLYTGMSHRN